MGRQRRNLTATTFDGFGLPECKPTAGISQSCKLLKLKEFSKRSALRVPSSAHVTKSDDEGAAPAEKPARRGRSSVRRNRNAVPEPHRPAIQSGGFEPPRFGSAYEHEFVNIPGRRADVDVLDQSVGRNDENEHSQILDANSWRGLAGNAG